MKTTPLSPVASAFAAFVTFAAFAPLAAAAPPAAASYRDGERIVTFERAAEQGPSQVGAEGAEVALTRVRLLFSGRARPIEAFVDATAIVALEPGHAAAELGLRLIRPLLPSRGLWLVADARGGDGLDLAARLAGAPGVRSASPNLYTMRKALGAWTPDDPRYPGQWFWDSLQMPTAWGRTKGDAATTIVVVDTGCDMTHPDLVNKMDPGLDPLEHDDDASYDATQSGAAHGTECAGLVAAETNNGVGIAGGCPDCRVRCVRLLWDKPVPTSADVEAFQFAIDTGAAVVSNSWGYVEPIPVPQALADAIAAAYDTGRGGLGALVLFAAGNDDRELADDELPAAYGVLAVGAVNNFDDATPFTNSGKAIDIVAPTGTNTTDIAGAEGDDAGDYTGLFGGTSSACPVAAGIAGLLVSVAPEKTAAELSQLLIDSARPAPYAAPDANGHDLVFGYGIVDPIAALDTLLGPEPSGAGGGGGAGGAGGGDGAGGAEPAAPGDEDAGCSCDVAGGSYDGRAGLSAATLAMFAALGLRRRRAPKASSDASAA